MPESRPKRLRIGELARRAGVTVPTVKHYLHEGLLPRPEKTGRTMAYYDESCVGRIRLIKKLQREKFLPLDVIKRLLSRNGGNPEELALGSAILIGRELLGPPVPESRVEKRSGYPLAKIGRLREAGLIAPVEREGTRYYDASDLEIIHLMKLREERGAPLEFSLTLTSVYRQAMQSAVETDIRMFARNYLGGVSPRQTVKLITEADEPLDRLVVLLRRKLLRSTAAAAVAEMDRVPGMLELLNFLPLPASALPAEPDDPTSRGLWRLARGDYRAAMSSGLPAAGAIFAAALAGDHRAALAIVEQHLPAPGTDSLDNVAAAFACVTAAAASEGLSEPVNLVRRTLGYLEVGLESGDDFPAVGSRWLGGAIMLMLPEIFGGRERGRALLAAAEDELKTPPACPGPSWVGSVALKELAPRMRARARRLLDDRPSPEKPKRGKQ